MRTSGRAFERMVDYLRARHDDGADAWVVQHIQAPDQAEALAERGREIFGTDPVFVCEIGPVIGTHAGPGLLGVGGITGAARLAARRAGEAVTSAGGDPRPRRCSRRASARCLKASACAIAATAIAGAPRRASPRRAVSTSVAACRQRRTA